jgi:acetamidase/formamidase
MKRLSLKKQEDLCYTISPFNKPKLKVNAGETIVIETEDAWSGQIRKLSDRRDYKKMPYTNPQSGPIYINDAKKGDTLAVEIKDVRPRIKQGGTFIAKWWWYLGHLQSNFTISNFLNVKIPENLKIMKIKNGKLYFNKLALPYKPMIGTIGTAPDIEAISTYLPGPHGGNMDLPCITSGSKLYLPVKVKGALLHLGDVHAIQGEGEISGIAAEMPAKVTVKIDLIKGKEIEWPRLENDDYIMAIACSGVGRGLEDAIRLAYVNLVGWMEEYGIDKWDAWELCSLLGKVTVGNIWTVAAGFPKKYL